EQRRLRFRRRPVDLVREDDLREDRPLDEAEPPRALFLVEDFRAGDVRRHEVRRELDPLELEVEDVGERLDQQRLGEPGHTSDEAVAAGEQRDQHLLDDVVLAHDDFAQLGENALTALGYFLSTDGGYLVQRRTLRSRKYEV